MGRNVLQSVTNMEEVTCRGENVFQLKKMFCFLLEGCGYCEKADMRVQNILGKLGFLVFYFKRSLRSLQVQPTFAAQCVSIFQSSYILI